MPVSTTRHPTVVRPAEVCAEIEIFTCVVWEFTIVYALTISYGVRICLLKG